MSIATKLEYLNNTKLAIKQAIIDIGGTVETTATFRSYADTIIDLFHPLPDEYQRVDYIQKTSRDNAYIQTDIYPTDSYEIQTMINIDSSVSGFGFAYGRATADDATDGIAFMATSEISVYPIWGAENEAVITSFDVLDKDLILTQNNTGLYINGETIDTYSTPMTSSDLPLYLFGLNMGGSLEEQDFAGKMYYLRAYDEGALVACLLPCYRKSDNVVGMYDVVFNQFYTNANSTGSFTYGNRVETSGTIFEKLDYLNQTKMLIMQAINAVGGNLTSADTFRSYASALANIQKLLFTGYPLIATDITKDTTFTDYRIYGNTSQDTTTSTPSPTNPVSVYGVGEARLPDEYQEVEYLEIATSGATINTGLYASLNTKAEVKYYCNSITGSYYILGSRTNYTNADSFGILRNSGNVSVATGTRNLTITSLGGVVIGSTYTIIFDNPNSSVTSNDTTASITLGQTTTTANPIYLFCVDNAGTSVLPIEVGARIYYYKQYESDVLVGNFVPCYRISDNEAGMYDTVTNTFFANSNTTGSFSVGADVEVSISVVNVNCYKNLFDPTSSDITDSSRLNNTGGILTSTSSDTAVRFVSEAIPVTAGETLVINWTTPLSSLSSAYDRMGFYNSATASASNVVSLITDTTDYKLTVPDGATYFRFTGLIANKDSYRVYSLQETVPLTIDRPLYRVVSTLPTDNTTAHTYEDYIDFNNKQVVRNTAYLHISSDNTITYQSTYSRFQIGGLTDLSGFNNSRRMGYCNRGVYSAGSTVGTVFVYSSGNIFYYPSSDITSVDLFKSWLDENYLYVIAPKPTTTYETVDLSSLPVYEGDSYYTVDGVEPSNMMGSVGTVIADS